MNPLIQLKQTTSVFLAAFGLACFGLSPKVQALSPPPSGGYPGFTTAVGDNALFSLGTGAGNTGLGWYALFSNSTGSFNTGVGAGALTLNNADSNTAVGAVALLLNTTGTENTAVGTDVLVFNDSGSENNAVGAFALYNNIDGTNNNAFGTAALRNNIHASDNTAIGDSALANNDVTGNNAASYNTAVGFKALSSNTDGNSNTAVGYNALINASLMAGDSSPNTAVGAFALAAVIGGDGNTAVGYGALEGSFGSSNTAIGFLAGSAGGDGNVYIGAYVFGQLAGEANHTYIRNINNTPVNGDGTDTVTVDLTTGLLGHLSSSRRYKEGIQPMDNVSEMLYRLKPVTYRYKKEIDPNQSPAFGLVAEDVAEVNPALVARNCQGQPESVHYEMVNAMLLNEFLKEHRKVEQLTKDFESKLAEQQKQIERLTAGLQKVSAQLELSKPAPQTVLNKQ